MATLLLRLAAPLQSWGATSKYENRKTNQEPTKSAVIGLLAAALGLRRYDDQAVQQLNSLGFAVRVDQQGELLMDFHTAGNPTPEQVKESRKKGKSENAQYITRRYYLSDAIFLVGIESSDTELLSRLQWALVHPVYPLFLGRRACPPTLPLCLGIRQADLLTALSTEPSLVPSWRHDGKTKVRILADCAPDAPGAVPQRDIPLSFSPLHRQFGYRSLRQITVDLPQGDCTGEQTTHDPFTELR